MEGEEVKEEEGIGVQARVGTGPYWLAAPEAEDEGGKLPRPAPCLPFFLPSLPPSLPPSFLPTADEGKEGATKAEEGKEEAGNKVGFGGRGGGRGRP